MKFKTGEKVKINIPGHSLHNQIIKILKIEPKEANPYYIKHPDNQYLITLQNIHLTPIKKKPKHQVFNI